MKHASTFFNVLAAATALTCLGVLLYFLVFEMEMPLTDAIIGLVGVYVIFGGIILTLAFGIPAVLSFLTMTRARHYAKKLQQAGYDVYINTFEVKTLSLQIVLLMIMSVLIALLTEPLFRNVGYFLDGTISIETMGSDNYYGVLGGNIMLGILYVTCVLGFIGIGYTSIKMWCDSFLPLRKKYLQLERGEEVDLPKIIHASSTF